MNAFDVPTKWHPEFTMAFQPIVDTRAENPIFAYEALVRGPAGEGADAIFAAVPETSLIAFDALCRSRAIEIAASLGLTANLSVNVSAPAISDRHYGLHTSFKTARQVGWPIERLIFEMTEHNPVKDFHRLGRWVEAARSRNVTIAIDDFGAAYAGLNTLLLLRPQMIKLDLALIRGIDTDRGRQALVKGLLDACTCLGCSVVAEGVETAAEFSTLSRLGITLMQGYFFAMPALASFPQITRTAFAAPDENLAALASTASLQAGAIPQYHPA
ncbi:MAG TPA: EAL domain-containing protein [Devosiaceae bacterium]|jgi:EAL domain-containing protein (putative c-di-GMP-specific phosphodiesterase class I)